MALLRMYISAGLAHGMESAETCVRSSDCVGQSRWESTKDAWGFCSSWTEAK
jgi:hypothetical protein